MVKISQVIIYYTVFVNINALNEFKVTYFTKLLIIDLNFLKSKCIFGN